MNIFLIIPRLIEQATWGGEYILESKKWQNAFPGKANLCIGQSYELSGDINLNKYCHDTRDPKFGGELILANGKKHYQGHQEDLLSLKNLIQKDPKKMLGAKYLRKHNPKHSGLNILIKYTQAYGNSYQLHLGQNQDSNKWQAKPESWYFLENGLITLGIRDLQKLAEYKKNCLEQDAQIQEIANLLQKKKITYNEANAQITILIKKYNLERYVNLVQTQRGNLIDLSQGGLHHSWEEDRNLPLGNIVYEVQVDTRDEVSTIRAFDKGKIDAQGNLRKLDIEDYFKYLDSEQEINNPENHRLEAQLIESFDNIKIESLLRTENYNLDKLSLDKGARLKCDTKDNFAHLFVENGLIEVSCAENSVIVSKAHSCFIPASTSQYDIIAREKSVVLRTF